MSLKTFKMWLMVIKSKWKDKLSNRYLLVFFCGVFLSTFCFFVIIKLKFNSETKNSFVLSNLEITEDYPSSENYQKAIERKNFDRDNEQEALSSIRLAIEFKIKKKFDKAMKLFKHALSLCPNSEIVLTQYGEFMEFIKRDLVSADELYYRALLKNPNFSKALANRQRTAELVQTIDEERLKRLDEKRDAISGLHENNAALRRAKKEAYIQNIYHSVGIEGNTMTLAETRSILETRMAVGGKSVDEHNEILGMDSAMKFINASLVNKFDFISIDDILEIHKRVLGHVDPIEGGVFRKTQVYVGNHVPPNPKDLLFLMNQFEEWLNSEKAKSLHPVKLAALAHYRLVFIHPFVDGNGRTSRLLMNTILMRRGYPPVIIQKQHRLKYYNFLQIANQGDIRPFVRFIADCTEKTLDLFLWATSELSYQVPMLLDQKETPTNPTIIDIEDDLLSGSGNEESLEES